MWIITDFNQFLDTNLDISLGLNEYLASVISMELPVDGFLWHLAGLHVLTWPQKL